MNRNATLIIVGFVSLVIGAVVAYFLFGPGKPTADPGPAKYVLMFGDPNPNGSQLVTADLVAFRAALTSPAPTPNWSTLQEVPREGATPTPIPLPTQSAPGGTVLMARVQVVQQGQNNGACTMHVTQKVGLSDPTQVRNVLAALDPSATPVPQ